MPCSFQHVPQPLASVGLWIHSNLRQEHHQSLPFPPALCLPPAYHNPHLLPVSLYPSSQTWVLRQFLQKDVSADVLHNRAVTTLHSVSLTGLQACWRRHWAFLFPSTHLTREPGSKWARHKHLLSKQMLTPQSGSQPPGQRCYIPLCNPLLDALSLDQVKISWIMRHSDWRFYIFER